MKQEIKKGFFYGITANVIFLSLTSLLTDVSSEMIQPLIPVFMASLGASVLLIGILGGLSDSIASLFDMLAGYWSDLKGKRKGFIIMGYSMSAIAKLIMSFVNSWQGIFVMRPIERIGKGMRDPPRDAVLAETTPEEVHGKVFGINRTFDRTGAIIGSVLTLIFLWLGITYNRIFFIASIFAFFSIIPLLFVKEKKIKPKKVSLKINLKEMPQNLKIFILISTLFALANFTYMIFVLRASELFSTSISVALYLLSNFLFQVFAIPAGIMADKVGKKKIIAAGYALFAITCVIFIFYQSLMMIIIGFALYGLSQALSTGNERAMVADLASKKILGTSLGTFYLFNSIASLPAGLIAGALWQYISPEAAFCFGALLAIIASIAFIFLKFEESRGIEKLDKHRILIENGI